MYYPLSFMPVEELPHGDDTLTTLPNPEDHVNPVPTRLHPVQAQKRSTQRRKIKHHSSVPQPPICHPSTSAVPATGDYRCHCCYFLGNISTYASAQYLYFHPNVACF